MRPDEACFVCYGVLFNSKLISTDLIYKKNIFSREEPGYFLQMILELFRIK